MSLLPNNKCFAPQQTDQVCRATRVLCLGPTEPGYGHQL
jgi:hypothetical protein